MTASTYLNIRTSGTCLVLLALLLQACAVTDSSAPAIVTSPLEQEAGVLRSAGDHMAAARLYLQAATQASGNDRHALELKAADSYIAGERYASARSVLQSLPLDNLSLLNLQHYDVNRATIALREQHPDTALAILAVVPMTGPFVADIHRLRAEAYSQNDLHFESARERVLLDPQIGNSEKRLQNHFQIWKSLNRLTELELTRNRTAPPPDPMSGWIDLLELSRLYVQQPQVMQDVIPQWQQRYPAHPANLGFIDAILGTIQVPGEPPNQVALLLPLTGKFSAPAAAIRDGMFTAYYDAPESVDHPKLRIYDSGETPSSALFAYRQAVAEGAGFIVGPLRKDSVEALSMQENLDVPVLALNHVPGIPLHSRSFFQFGLAPEDEAREVARAAWQDGHRRSIALIPANDWGERVAAAFAETWEGFGGEVLDIQRYDNTQTDHGGVISQALNLDSSDIRHGQLTRLLGTQLEFEHRRRQDIDFVFLLASPLQARLIGPQLNFYRASSLPVYSTSQVYTGIPDPEKDLDLNGIIFCDMPWILEQNAEWSHLQRSIDENWPENSSRYKRLYALGIDAYRIIPVISQLGGGMFDTFAGVSGNLSLDARGQIKRELRCAQFSGGQPRLLKPLERMMPQPVTPPVQQEFPMGVFTR